MESNPGQCQDLDVLLFLLFGDCHSLPDEFDVAFSPLTRDIKNWIANKNEVNLKAPYPLAYLSLAVRMSSDALHYDRFEPGNCPERVQKSIEKVVQLIYRHCLQLDEESRYLNRAVNLVTMSHRNLVTMAHSHYCLNNSKNPKLGHSKNGASCNN